MILGLVGSEEAKFTKQGKIDACNMIRDSILRYKPTGVVSGGCHLGGVDIWAIEVAKEMGISTTEFLPEGYSWLYYKSRNELIAEESDAVVCITVAQLPPGFKEGGWEKYCYHCKTDKHIKSGGCWTMKRAHKLGKATQLFVVPNGPSE